MKNETVDPRVEHYRDLVRARVAGRRVILVRYVVAGTTLLARQLLDLGAERVLILSAIIGAGALPEAGAIDWRLVGEPPPAGADLSEELRHFERQLRAPDDETLAAIEAFDPEHTAIVLPDFVLDFDAVAGRPNRAPREPAWVALEDKLVVDALWDAVGVPRAESRAVAATAEALAAAHAALDRGAGTVWAGDAREGFHGGATKTRWVQRAEDVAETAAFFAARCDRVRVMPFLAGVPCSIHGVVFADGVAALRPCEMVVLPQPGRTTFRYAGVATFWDPPAAERESMRALARRVGAALRARVGYRGTFTIDGVMTAEGFRPTELNPRFGAGINVLAASITGLPMVLVDLFVRAGDALDGRPAMLEQLIVEAADARRGGGGWTVAQGSAPAGTHRLVHDAGGWRPAGEGEAGMATLVVGAAAGGGTFVRFLPDADAAPVGPSLAPMVVEVFAWCARRFGLDFGPIAAAGG